MRVNGLLVIVLVLVGVNSAVAQVMVLDKIAAESNAVIGSDFQGPLDTLSDVLRIIGVRDVVNGAATMRPLVLDNDGDLLRDTNTTVSTAGAWTFNQTMALLSGVNITGNVTPASGTLPIVGGLSATGNILSSAGAIYARGDVPIAASGVDEVRLGKRTTFDWPTILLEDAGFMQWNMDNAEGVFRLYRRDATGFPSDTPTLALTIDGNMTIGPYGKRVLPSTPYGVDLGSQQYKFGALWTGDLYADRLVTIENIGTVDNRWLIGSGNTLDEDLSPSATSMVTRYNNYATGTFVYLQKFARTEFIKTTSGATLTNKVTNGSFETGATTGWSGTNATLSASTTKAFHGETSMLVDSSSNPSVAEFTSFSFTTGTTYTVCLNARRVDGATIADGDITLIIRDAHTGMIAQQTATDAWVRMCRTAVAGSDAETNVYLNFKGVDYYVDAVQVEETSTQRPYSEYRASYSISRNQEGGSGVANQWYSGDGMFSVGASTGDGWLDCYAIRGIKSATEQGPACVANVRTGSSYNSWAPRVAWGNLDGLYGYSGTTHGFAAGDSSAAWIGFDSTNGLRGMHSSTKKFGIDMSGVASFVEGAVTIDNLGIRIANTATSTDQAKAYGFTGALSYLKRPLTGYLESGGAGTIVLSGGDRASGNAHVLIEAPVGDILLAPTGGHLKINGTTAFSGTCSAASFTVVEGLITSC